MTLLESSIEALEEQKRRHIVDYFGPLYNKASPDTFKEVIQRCGEQIAELEDRQTRQEILASQDVGERLTRA